MARSTYIYVVIASDSDIDTIAGTFTVKHEMETYVSNYKGIARLSARRYRDGNPDLGYTPLVLKGR